MRFKKIFLIVSFVFFVVNQLWAQTQFNYPMCSKDIRVYVNANTKGRRTVTHIIQDTIIINTQLAYAGVKGFIGGLGFWKFGYENAAVDSNNYFIVTGQNTQNIIEEIFPLNPYSRDTLFLHSYRTDNSPPIDTTFCVILHRFDTTLFNKNAHVYIMQASRGNDTCTYTIADTFGIVTVIHWGKFQPIADKYILSSAEIQGIKYNRDNRTQRMMELCNGNIYQYCQRTRYRQNQWVQYVFTVQVVGDTLIYGRSYFILEGVRSLGDYFKENRIFLREGVDGLYSYFDKDSLCISDYESIGSPIISQYFPKIIGDTLTFTDSLGYARRRLRTSEPYDDWVAPFGIVYFQKEVFTPAQESWGYLTYARVCGQEYGKLVSVDDYQNFVPQYFLSQNYPNPFSISTAITYQISTRDHVRLEVFDMLGRKVATLVDEEQDAGEHTSTFNIHNSEFDVHQGVYLYRMTNKHETLIKKMIIIR